MFTPSYFFISLRYLQTANQHSTMKTMIRICGVGIFIATFAFALIISINKGFEQAMYTKMQSIYPQLIIDAHGQELNYEQLQPILQDPVYHILHYAPQKSAHALCKSIENSNTPYVIHVQGIQPTQEKHVTALESMIMPKGQLHPLEALIQNNQVMIGKQLAQQLNASTGSQLYLMYTPDEEMSEQLHFEQKKVIVSAIFDTGIEEFDAHLMYCDFDFFSQLFPDHGITQVYLQADSAYQEKEIIEKLQHRLQLNIYSWKKLYSSLVAALDLEKYAMLAILFLIILIAASNIISLMFMYITQKRKDIAILLTFGLPVASVRTIFLMLSMTISVIAASLGLLFACIVGVFLQNFRWIPLPDNVYYTAHLPIIIESPLFLYIFFAVLTITFFASLIPLKKIKTENIATILRNEV